MSDAVHKPWVVFLKGLFFSMASSSQTANASNENTKGNKISQAANSFNQQAKDDYIKSVVSPVNTSKKQASVRKPSKQLKKLISTGNILKQESDSEIEVYDDDTTNFLWEAHSITVFGIGTAVLFYFVFFETQKDNVEINVKRGIIATMYAFLAIGVTLTQNGPVIRPHPVFWRLFLCACYLYELSLVFFLFQTVKDARRFLLYIDPSLNKPLNYKDYAGACKIWDPGHPDGPFHNVVDKIDIFAFAHLFGWFWKALIFRDAWITNTISFMFELLGIYF